MDRFDKVAYDTKYSKEHYDIITVKSKKENNHKARLQALVKKTGKSITAIIVDAIEELLRREGL